MLGVLRNVRDGDYFFSYLLVEMEIAFFFFASSKKEGNPVCLQYCEWDELFA